jgi:hypothetical protein
MERTEEALAMAVRAVYADPDHDIAHMLRVGSLHTLGRNDVALAALQPLLTRSPRRAFPWCALLAIPR